MNNFHDKTCSSLFSGYTVFICTILLFYVLNRLVKRCGLPTSAHTDPWVWRNHVISGIHGLMAGIWSLISIVLYPQILTDPGNFHTPMIFYLVDFCSGYFLYDFMDYFINKKSLQHWEVTLHHIACISAFWYNWHTCTFIGLSFIALLVEGNSFFLHARKLLRLCRVDQESIEYRVCIISNIFTFMLYRLLPIMRVIYGLYEESRRNPFLLMAFTAILTVIVTTVNTVLFWRLVKTDLIRPYFRPIKCKETNRNGHVTINGVTNNGFHHIKSS